MYLLVNELLISLPLHLGEALLAEAIGTNEDPHILKVILLLLNVVLALHYGEVEDLSLISLVTMEGRYARTYLFDLHAVGKLAALHIDLKISNELLKFLILLGERIHRFSGLAKKLLKVSIILDFLLFGQGVQTHLAIVVE
jgi:hypothetical protein